MSENQLVKFFLIDPHDIFFPILGQKISAFEKKSRKINILFEAIFKKKKNPSGSEKLWSYMTSTDGREYHNSGSTDMIFPCL